MDRNGAEGSAVGAPQTGYRRRFADGQGGEDGVEESTDAQDPRDFSTFVGPSVGGAPRGALAPLAISAGLLPLTLAGIGTRDAALIFLYRPYLDPATGAALGWLCTSRYVVLALAVLPFVHGYLGALRKGGVEKP